MKKGPELCSYDHFTSKRLFIWWNPKDLVHSLSECNVFTLKDSSFKSFWTFYQKNIYIFLNFFGWCRLVGPTGMSHLVERIPKLQASPWQMRTFLLLIRAFLLSSQVSSIKVSLLQIWWPLWVWNSLSFGSVFLNQILILLLVIVTKFPDQPIRIQACNS